jgi:CheY-like chemotaxis protein
MLVIHRAPLETEQGTKTRPPAPPRILVADADDDTRALYRVLFARDGYDVVEASDGRDALTKVLMRPPPTLVVTEIALPLVDGYALCEIVRQDRATADVPILVVTAEGRPAQVNRARQAGADAVLVKPATPDTILYETRWLLANCKDLRARSSRTAAGLAAQGDGPAGLLARSEPCRRTVLAKSFERFATTTPPASPLSLTCPSCDRRLTYAQSHIGGVSNRHPEQWDYFKCQSCGTFQYRQRTRTLRRVPW